MSELIHLISTRRLKTENKSILEKSGISIGDYDFVVIKKKNLEKIKKLLEANTSPLVFTSQNAVHAIEELVPVLEQKEAFTISGVTEKELTRLGLSIIGRAPTGGELAQVIVASGEKSVLHLTSNIRRHELEQGLISSDIQIKILEVYEKIAVPRKVGNLDGILFWSPSQIDSFISKNTLSREVPAFCIGKTTAHHLENLGHENIVISRESREESMIEAVLNYFSYV